MIDLTNKRFVILGLQGSGKTILAKHLLSKTKKHLVYDVVKEYKGFNRYIPTDRNSKEELESFIQVLVFKRVKPSLLIIDEANRYLEPKPTALPLGISELNDLSRHIGISWGVICRRPVQLHSDMMELAHYLFIFNLRGKNDISYLDTILPGLGDTVANLKPYEFAVVSDNREITVHEPLHIEPNI